MWYFLYNLVLSAGFACALPFTPFIALLGSRYRDGFIQRLGFYPKALLASLASARPLWIHAASVGEVRSVEPLVQELKARAPQRKILISTFTSTGQRIAHRIGGVDGVILLPLDVLWIVRRALISFRPSALLIIETEIWPNLVREAFRQGVPTLLLSGRLSAKAFSRYAFFHLFFRVVLSHFTVLGMQSAADAARMRQLGASEKKLSVVGSLKFAFAKTEKRGECPKLAECRDKPLLVVGSSHRGEEEILLQAFATARSRFPQLSMVLAPRHPERFAEVEKLLIASPFEFRRRSQVNDGQIFEKDILLLDTLGELADFFAIADIAFVGGSLVDAGGHNILEPARYHKPVLFGPNMSNFQSVAEQMKQSGAAIEVGDADDLAQALVSLLADTSRRHRMGQAASQIVATNSQALTQNCRLAERYL
jgi:3-deoxy-D-manno-octulosonic-acid transferase